MTFYYRNTEIRAQDGHPSIMVKLQHILALANLVLIHFMQANTTPSSFDILPPFHLLNNLQLEFLQLHPCSCHPLLNHCPHHPICLGILG